jgi:hypothetical protein
MTNRFFPEKNIRNARVARPVSGRVFVWLAIIAVAGALLSSGFVISGRQHFEAVSIGYESEELRQQAAELEERIRQLDLEYARVSSPVEIERAAQKIGLQHLERIEAIRRPINDQKKREGKKKEAKPTR